MVPGVRPCSYRPASRRLVGGMVRQQTREHPRQCKQAAGNIAAPERRRPARVFPGPPRSRRGDEADQALGETVRLPTYGRTTVPQASRRRVLGASRPESARPARRRPNSPARTRALPRPRPARVFPGPPRSRRGDEADQALGETVRLLTSAATRSFPPNARPQPRRPLPPNLAVGRVCPQRADCASARPAAG